MFPGLMFKPGQGGSLPLIGRRRFAVGAFGKRFQPPKIYGQFGSLEVRLARKNSEIRRAQRLRYKVFYEEMSAMPGALAILSRRDEDEFDPIFDHLLVIDRGDANDGRRWRRSKVVGTYRMLRHEVADLNDGFYTQGEYDISALLRAKPECKFMELGRSCVLKPYRNKRTLELLWQGVWSYVREHNADVMIGCASFEGTDPSVHAEALSFLHHTSLAPEEWRVRAHEHLRVDMNMMPREAINSARGDQGAAAADQGLSAGGRLCRRRRRDRSPIRHHRRVRHHAGRGDQARATSTISALRRVRHDRSGGVCPA